MLEDLTWWDVIKTVGPLFLSALGIIAFGYWGTTDIEKAFFTRVEKVKYFFTELLMWSLMIYIVFLIIMLRFGGDKFSLTLLIMWAFITVLVSLAAVLLYGLNVRRKKEGEYYYYLDAQNNRIFIKGRLNETEVILSKELDKNKGEYLVGFEEIRNKEVEKIKAKDLFH